MLTKRDKDIVRFLEKYKIASTSMLSHFFFKYDSSCRRRLKYLYDNQIINRERYFVTNEYLYFIKKPPAQLKHSLYVIKFYTMLDHNYKVNKFDVEKKFGDIRPDAVFSYEEPGGRKITGLLEVELSNKGLNQTKYERFASSKDYAKYFTAPPPVFAVTERPVHKGTNIQFIHIDLEKIEKY